LGLAIRLGELGLRGEAVELHVPAGQATHHVGEGRAESVRGRDQAIRARLAGDPHVRYQHVGGAGGTGTRHAGIVRVGRGRYGPSGWRPAYPLRGQMSNLEPPADARERSPRLISVVAPMFDEEQTVELFYDRVRAALEGMQFELVLVDDASSDRTAQLLNALADADPRVRVLHLSRNFGHQAALTAGLEHARGDVVVMLDGDLQDPPELIRDMLDRWSRGFDVVFGVRESRAGESRFKLASARWFYRLFAKL